VNVTALPAGLRRFALTDLPRERWRNGAGWTRTIACAESDGQIDWRVSLAEISEGAPFSQFPGMDRTAVLAAGGPVLLRGPERQWNLAAPGDMACFAGEWSLENAPPKSEARIWNVMMRRGHACADVQVIAGRTVALSGDGHALAWVLQGSFRATSPTGEELFLLEADEGLHRRPAPRALVLLPTSSDARLVRTQLR
jgi:environmental stress-induced protein Ves